MDDTLVLTRSIEPLRRQRRWSEVYRSFERTKLPAGTHEFVASVRSRNVIGVVTTSPRVYAERLLEFHRLDVPVLVAYHDVRFRKPHPEPIVRAAHLMGIPTERCVYIGDQWSDYVAASSAGAEAILVHWGESLASDLVRQGIWVCRSWSEVARAIDRMGEEATFAGH